VCGFLKVSAMDNTTYLCHLDDIPDREARGFDPTGVGRDTLFIVRQGGEIYGWHDKCPHEGDTPLPWRRHGYLNKKQSRIVCFAHGAQFEITSGKCILGPCLGQQLEPLRVVVGRRGEVVVVECLVTPTSLLDGSGNGNH
jgi:nitrite reductase/ring-hydroxylating ferredoxin subunit